ncbi:SUMO-activating enzyme subunit 2-B [Drosophila willistoni]|uniref:SUMO-activating enzyme subunit 2-B n=1 Tax=Drosophila willistoni TaxID=7260 RepID=UPI00017D7725|nr:SUMO-activating enzyme subunit 2-B [Drosophila willistoni]
MAASIDGILPKTLQELVKSSKVLVVGAGGIGCEVLKNLVLSGFLDIEIIDLDTIDLSNLNRQFLFHREHVGKSKANVARESALSFNPDSKIIAHHDSVTSAKYGVNFFKKFNVVLSALDNRAARNHVNRMCLNADVPLIESGTSGYNGQVEIIKRGLTQCYECTPKEKQRSFPGCTIRNTPSEPIHCIVWAKHLFNQLFGESLEDEDISPDSADPEAQDKKDDAKEDEVNAIEANENEANENEANENEANKNEANAKKANENEATGKETNENEANEKEATEGDANEKEANEKEATEGEAKEQKKEDKQDDGNIVRINTRQWAKDCEYDPTKLFNKFFNEDINYLLRMSNLWESRKAPTPIEWSSLQPVEGEVSEYGKQHHRIWSIGECSQIFANTLKDLSSAFLNLEGDDTLVWDKDDQPAMDFVSACANIRSHIFDIEKKSRFEIKSMAGNIIPAIATTNAITAGLSVMRAFNVLQSKWKQCNSVYARLRTNGRNQFLVPDTFFPPPNPNCYVCASDPAIILKVDTKRITIKDLRDEILIKTLNMVDPDVTVDRTGSILLSSEEGETTENEGKLLSEMNVVDGVILECDDFHQNYKLRIIINHFDADREDNLFEVVADKSQLQPKDEIKEAEDKPVEEKRSRKRSANGNDSPDDGPSTSKRSRPDPEEDDCMVIEDDDDDVVITSPPDNDSDPSPPSPKKPETGCKRKASTDITEILDSSDEDDDDNTQPKKTKLDDTPSDVINID